MKISNKKPLLKYNESTYFLLPSFGLTARELNAAGFVNSYLMHENIPKTTDEDVWIYLLFKTNDVTIKNFHNFLWEMRFQKSLIDHWGCKHDYWVAVIKLHKQFEDDFMLFIEGRYSEFSQLFKNTIPKEVTLLQNNELVTVPTTMHEIITKNDKMKKFVENELNIRLSVDDEYWPAPDLMAREVLWMEQFYRIEEKENSNDN
jgi:hypothetical protein